MIASLRQMYRLYSHLPRVLLVLVTDGEPSDGSYDALFSTLSQLPRNMYISMVECNDNEEEMDYLSGWDTRLPRFHNQEDYGEELALVRRVNGQSTKFTRANYVQMILLSPIYPKYAIDIRSAGGKWNPFSGSFMTNSFVSNPWGGSVNDGYGYGYGYAAGVSSFYDDRFGRTPQCCGACSIS
jgi:hypothetical protein